ncbi:Clp protease N-terminal domain-containing protein [Kribbella yunnanensis]|uniref:Clp protease N-terminal domain-containing protein n=1 Tax=Kribbella yunnanensis TaxID=190194 RepID=A0ABP4TNI5_9ACTN
MTPGPDLQQLINTIKDDTGSDDELLQLATAASTISELTSTGDAALGFFVDRARGAGKSWVEISSVLGVSKQAAHKRFADSFGTKSLDRFTPRTTAVVQAAVDVANGRNQHFVGAEHLLLAFFTQPAALATQVLVGRGLTEQKLHEAVELVSPVETTPPPKPIDADDPPYTRGATHVLQGAVASALTLGHNYVGTEHLLLSFYRDTGGIATKILIEQGLDEDTALRDIRGLLDQLAK